MSGTTAGTEFKHAIAVIAKWVGGAIAVALMIAGGAFLWERLAPLKLSSDYQAVLLANGSVYFGKLEGADSHYPILREVYYVQSGVDPVTKAPKNILLKRGNEWHSPDHMVLNGSQIVLIEPVGATSRVASLIAELKAGH